MAQITWTFNALQTYTPEQLECAARGGTWDRVNGQCTMATSLPPAEPLLPPTSQVGSVDPQQMFDDGFVYINGKWVKADSPEALEYMRNPKGVPPPSEIGGGLGKTLNTLVTVLPGGTVLGNTVPAAPPVLLPSFVGGRLGEIREPGGMRPVSGGRPDRVQMGLADMPVVRMRNSWGR